MKILTKRQADAAIVASVFCPGGSLACIPKIRLDLGKYKPGTCVGKDVPAHLNVRLAWVERRRDKYGPHEVLWCIPAERGEA